MSDKKKAERERLNDLSVTATEIGNLQSSLGNAYLSFNNTTDSDALEACIFEISALRSRYNTALKHYRDRYY